MSTIKIILFITNKSLDSSLSFLTPIKIDNYSEITSIVESLIEIKNECESDGQTEIIELRRQLEKANRRIDELESTSNRDKLLERESLKYFTKGVELSLSNKPMQAADEYKIALELKPDLHDALYNWGTDLVNLATKEGKEAEALYKQAIDKFQKAIDIKPDNHEASHNWGTCLGYLAETKEGKEAEALYNQAFDKFQKAIDIKPDYHEAFNNWGTTLGHLAKTQEGKEAEALYNQAIDKFQKAIEYGASSYNLSCILALQGEAEKALRYLEISLSKNEIDVDFVENDEDWENYLGDKEFVDLLSKFKR